MLPAIRPLIVFVLAIRIMDAFRFFDTIYVLTSGGPGTATETITLYTYALAFRLLQIGKASALGVLTLLFVGGADPADDRASSTAASGAPSDAPEAPQPASAVPGALPASPRST